MSNKPENPNAMMIVPEGEKLSVWLARDIVRERIANSLGGIVDADAFTAQILIAVEQPELKECSAQSKFEAVLKVSTLGLLPALNQVALIPRAVMVGPKGNKKFSHMGVHVMPQWQGFKALLLRIPEVLDITADLVHQNDTYQWDGVTFTHVYDPFDDRRRIKTLADLKGGYIRVDFRDKRTARYHFVTGDYMSQCRSCAESTAVWDKWPAQQALKTVYRSLWARRIINFDPLSEKRIQEVEDLDNDALGNAPIRIESRPQTAQEYADDVVEDSLPDPQSPTQEPASEAPGDVDGNVELTPLEELARHIEEFDDVDRLEERKKVVLGSTNPFKLSAAEKGKAFPMFDNAIAALRQKGG